MGSVRQWFDNFRRMTLGRPTWDASREFAYYCVDDRVVRQHRERQDEFEREAFATGLRIMRAIGLLDRRIVAGARVLDFGAGECLLSEAIAFGGNAAEVWATDAVPKQIWAAADRYATRQEIRFLVADACNLPFENAQFDIAVANLVLHHIHPLEAVLAEAYRALKPGGRFAAFEPNPVLGSLAHDKSSENEAPVPPRAVVRALETVGFIDAKYEYWWSRFETSKVGIFSPGYRVTARKPGTSIDARNDRVRLRRPIAPMKLRGLQIDSSCQFASLARTQEEEILTLAS